MKPGGVIRTVWPAMDLVDWLRSDEDLSDDPFVIGYYNKNILKDKYAPSNTDHLSKQLQCVEGLLWQKGQHKYLWYKDEMINALKDLGFKEVKECDYMKSKLEDFNNIEKPDKLRELHSTIVEAVK